MSEAMMFIIAAVVFLAGAVAAIYACLCAASIADERERKYWEEQNRK